MPEIEKKSFDRTFWTLNGIEMFERLAYFSVRAVVPVYIMQANDPGGLHFTAAAKGVIYGWWFIFQSILPTFTGGYADRYGYKKTLAFAVSMNIIGYLMMAYLRTYTGFFFGIIVLASGTAFFKPSLQGSLAQSLTKKNSSVGWGIFYWVVNIGAAIGPFSATWILGDPHTQMSWKVLFISSAAITALNYLMLFTFKDVPSGARKDQNPLQVFVYTIKNILEPRLLTWLLIMSCFWLMMYQLWDLHPNFIEDWVDSSTVAAMMPFDQWRMNTDRGVMVPQQILLNLNALLIILLMVPISWAVRRMRTLSSMVIGMTVATVGILVAGFTGNGWVLLLGIVFFSLGEMLTGPKKNEYLGLIAPPGKKALYLGYVNIPVGIGGFVGSNMAGYLYGNYGEKATLALKYLAQHTEFGAGKGWDGKVNTLESVLGVSRTDAMLKLQEVCKLDAIHTTKLLWDTYHPQYHVWIPFAAIGFVAIFALIIFNQMAKKWSDMNA
jgi:proton-dependent oligopeptide transporter, POT family